MNIRFKGYSEDWEQRKFGEVVDVRSGRDYKHLAEGDIPVYGTGGYMLSVDEALSEDEDAIGIGRKGTIDNPYILRAPFWTVDTLFYVIPRDKYDLNFVFDIFQNVNWKAKDESTGVPSLSKATINEVETLMPKYAEQKKIGEYFSNLDHLITLHQRKCEQTQKLKKYMLQKMFPQDKTNVPKIRFDGFTDAWEQRKLGEVLDDMYNGQTPSRKRDEYWNGNIRWLSSGELNRGIVYSSIETITEEGKKSANLRVVPKGTFVMAITGLEASGTRGNCALLGFDTTLNQSCMALFPKQDILISQFLFQWYRMVGEEYGINYTQGTKQQSYNAELIKILPILLPSIDEQKKIASYLNSIDHLITLHHRKYIYILKSP